MSNIEAHIAEIRAMDLPSLRDAWRRHHRAPPPRRLSRDLLVRGIAYRLQEQAHGGLSKATQRRLRTLRPSPRPAVSLRGPAPRCAPARGWCAPGKAGPMSSLQPKAVLPMTARPMLP